MLFDIMDNSNSLRGGVGVKDPRNSGRVGGKVGQSVQFADLLWSYTDAGIVLTCQVHMTKLVALIVAPELYYI